MSYGFATPHGDLISRDSETVATITAKEAAARYGVHVSTIYRRCRRGQIIATKNSRGRWEILNNGVSLEVARVAAEMRARFAARATLDAAPIQTAVTRPTFTTGSDMLARRRAAIAARSGQLIAA